MEQDPDNINRDNIVRDIGCVVLSAVTLAEQTVITKNLEATGTKSRNAKELFPKLASHGSETFSTLIDLVLAVQTDLYSFVHEDLKDYVSLAHIERRAPVYLRAILEGESDEIINSATSIWFRLINDSQDVETITRRGLPATKKMPDDYYSLPRKQKKQAKKDAAKPRLPNQRNLSANQKRRSNNHDI
jgi:hypothetical protein